MLPLYGIATAARGFDPAEPRQVLRLRSPKEGPEHVGRRGAGPPARRF